MQSTRLWFPERGRELLQLCPVHARLEGWSCSPSPGPSEAPPLGTPEAHHGHWGSVTAPGPTGVQVPSLGDRKLPPALVPAPYDGHWKGDSGHLTWSQAQATRCPNETLDMLSNLSMPQVLHLENGYNNNTCCTGLFGGLNALHLCLAHNKHFICLGWCHH